MSEAAKPPSGRRMKGRAPPPPPPAPSAAPQPAPRHIFRNADGGETSGAEAKENLLRTSLDLQLTLPHGHTTTITADGSKALMDLLVELCSRHHLNPALHTLELQSAEGQLLGFKPNALLGSLDVACVSIKERLCEEKVARRPAPKVPEKTVRLMVNYHGSQKAVVRVNPLAPLHALIPAVCDKCELEAAHVLLLRDGVGRHKLPLDKSLSELGIKELYVLDQRLVLQPKMASAPALNLTDSICSSTNSLARAEKKGLLGLLPFGRRKSKTEAAVMDDNADTHSNGVSMEERPSTLGQSQSVGNVSRLSPKFDTKKRRAPAPPPGTATGSGTETPSAGQISLESYQVASESQQRKRKAPAPPPTPDTCSSVETPTPLLRTKMADAVVVVSPVAREAAKPVAQAPAPMPTRRSPTPSSSSSSSSSSSESLAVQDSSSELSGSLDDSELEAEQSGGGSSTLSSSSASASHPDPAAGSASTSDAASTLDLKLEEMENNRHSAMGTSERAAPPKPRRAPALEQQQPPPPPPPQQQPPSPPPTPPPPPFSPPIEPTESSSPQTTMEPEEAAPQSWLHSRKRSADRPPLSEAETPEAETLSLGSSGDSSLPDQGYAASEGTAEGEGEGEDSGLRSSPSDTQPTSPDGSLTLDRGGSRGGPPPPIRDNSSDSDEGCATWGSRHRHADIKAKSGKTKDTYGEDPDLTAQLHQTLARFEADLADRMDSVSEKSCVSTELQEVPVSVVDMDVPVTAIDEVLEDYVEHEAKSHTGSRSADCKEAAAELQNKNNNANATTAAANAGSSAGNGQQRRGGSVGRSGVHQRQQKAAEAEGQEPGPVAAPSSPAEPHKQKPDPARSIAHRLHADKKAPAALGPLSPSPSARREQAPSSSSAVSHSKITTNTTSRFGMKTFTVVPPKPAVLPVGPGQPAATLTAGAIKIDEQGNMVKAGFQWSRARAAPESGAEGGEGEGPALLGRAKAFWSSNQRQESAPPLNTTPSDRGGRGAAKPAGPQSPEATSPPANAEDPRTSQSAPHRAAERTAERTAERAAERTAERAAERAGPGAEGVTEPPKLSVERQLEKPPSQKAPLHKPPPKGELPFLKPSRRTSSQYVASAITKYAPKTPAKPAVETPGFLNKHSGGFQRSAQVKLGQSASDSARSRPPPRTAADFPDSASESHRERGGAGGQEGGAREGRGGAREDKGGSGASKGSLHSPETATAHRELGPPPSGPSVNHHAQRVRGASPSRGAPPPSSAKPPMAPKTGTLERSSVSASPAPEAKPEASVIVSNGGSVPGPPPPPAPVTLFGPVQKFRPVICRSVEKETSLHSSLMEAIQTGGGRDRLRKISTSAPNFVKKTSYVEEENERSALLAAIRAQNNSGRLKKTKSEAAEELEHFRKSASEDPSGAPLSSPLTSSPPPVFAAAPPPPPMAPPPPPPALASPPAGGRPAAENPIDAALARAAMLEAIRSGSAAEKLKKVAPPTKTLQVNGRLGTMRAASLTSQP